MGTSEDVREFLASRRGRITPEQAGLPDYGGKRRVPGLRREEVALLAGISVEYYTRLERGNARGVSESVLEGIARALQLDEAERAHLIDLVRIANTTRQVRRPTRQRVRPSVQRILDSMTETPALVQNGRLDILHANQLGPALFSEIFRDPVRPANAARFVFLDPRATEFYVEWERIAHDVVALLRAEARRDPYDRALSDLIGELSTRSEEFRVRWAAHDVRGVAKPQVKHLIGVSDPHTVYRTPAPGLAGEAPGLAWSWMWPPGSAPFPELCAGRARVRSPDGCVRWCAWLPGEGSRTFRLTNLPPGLSAAPPRGVRAPQRDAI